MMFPIKITKGGELNKEDVISKSKEEVTLDIQLYINICSSLSRRITHDIAFELFQNCIIGQKTFDEIKFKFLFSNHISLLFCLCHEY